MDNTANTAKCDDCSDAKAECTALNTEWTRKILLMLLASNRRETRCFSTVLQALIACLDFGGGCPVRIANIAFPLVCVSMGLGDFMQYASRDAAVSSVAAQLFKPRSADEPK